jgi:tetratricopeptide (TPR) repeat protein
MATKKNLEIGGLSKLVPIVEGAMPSYLVITENERRSRRDLTSFFDEIGGVVEFATLNCDADKVLRYLQSRPTVPVTLLDLTLSKYQSIVSSVSNLTPDWVAILRNRSGSVITSPQISPAAEEKGFKLFTKVHRHFRPKPVDGSKSSTPPLGTSLDGFDVRLLTYDSDLDDLGLTNPLRRYELLGEKGRYLKGVGRYDEALETLLEAQTVEADLIKGSRISPSAEIPHDIASLHYKLGHWAAGLASTEDGWNQKGRHEKLLGQGNLGLARDDSEDSEARLENLNNSIHYLQEAISRAPTSYQSATWHLIVALAHRNQHGDTEEAHRLALPLLKDHSDSRRMVPSVKGKVSLSPFISGTDAGRSECYLIAARDGDVQGIDFEDYYLKRFHKKSDVHRLTRLELDTYTTLRNSENCVKIIGRFPGFNTLLGDDVVLPSLMRLLGETTRDPILLTDSLSRDSTVASDLIKCSTAVNMVDPSETQSIQASKPALRYLERLIDITSTLQTRGREAGVASRDVRKENFQPKRADYRMGWVADRLDKALDSFDSANIIDLNKSRNAIANRRRQLQADMGNIIESAPDWMYTWSIDAYPRNFPTHRRNSSESVWVNDVRIGKVDFANADLNLGLFDAHQIAGTEFAPLGSDLKDHLTYLWIANRMAYHAISEKEDGVAEGLITAISNARHTSQNLKQYALTTLTANSELYGLSMIDTGSAEQYMSSLISAVRVAQHGSILPKIYSLRCQREDELRRLQGSGAVEVYQKVAVLGFHPTDNVQAEQYHAYRLTNSAVANLRNSQRVHAIGLEESLDEYERLRLKAGLSPSVLSNYKTDIVKKCTKSSNRYTRL